MIREVRIYGDSVLARKAEPVKTVDAAIHDLVRDMFETMYQFNGIGLSAVQIGVSLDVFVADVERNGRDRTVLLNAKLLDEQGASVAEEGCLSVPGVTGNVKRAEVIRVAGLDLNGELVQREYSGLMARVVQHEVDHLNGVLFVERLNPIEALSVQPKLKRLKTQRGASPDTRSTPSPPTY